MARPRPEPPGGAPGVSLPMPAPGELATLQAFVNTAPTDRDPDVLASPEALSRWLARRRWLPAGTEIPAEAFERVLRAREDVRALLAAKTRGRLDAEAAARLEREASEALCRLRFDDGGPVGIEPAGASVDGALVAILAAFATARATVHWPRFRLCARRGCRRAFYDASRSRTGKWCTPRCGNRARGAAYRRSRKPG